MEWYGEVNNRPSFKDVQKMDAEAKIQADKNKEQQL